MTPNCASLACQTPLLNHTFRPLFTTSLPYSTLPLLNHPFCPLFTTSLPYSTLPLSNHPLLPPIHHLITTLNSPSLLNHPFCPYSPPQNSVVQVVMFLFPLVSVCMMTELLQRACVFVSCSHFRHHCSAQFYILLIAPRKAQLLPNSFYATSYYWTCQFQ